MGAVTPTVRAALCLLPGFSGRILAVVVSLTAGLRLGVLYSEGVGYALVGGVSLLGRDGDGPCFVGGRSRRPFTCRSGNVAVEAA